MTLRNVFANIAGRIWGFLALYAFVPFYLQFLGVEGYAVVGFYTTLVAVIAFADMGFTATHSTVKSHGSKLLKMTRKKLTICCAHMNLFIFLYLR